MKKIIDWFGGSVIKDLLGGLDKLFTSKEEKIKVNQIFIDVTTSFNNFYHFLATRLQDSS